MNGQTDTRQPLPPPTAPEQPGHQDEPRHSAWRSTPVARDPQRGKLGGVIAGVADAYGFDLRTTRIAVAIATLVLPVIAVLYIAAWLMLPARPDEARPLQDVIRDRRRLPLLIALGLVAVVAAMGSFGSWLFLGGLPWGVGLIALGVLLWAAPDLLSSTRSATPTEATAATPTETPTATTTTTEAATATTTPMPSPRPPAPPTPAQPRRARRPVGAIGVLIAFGTLAVMASGDALGWWTTTVLAAAITALCILAAGQVVAGFVNHRWMVVPGLIVLGMLVSFLLVVRPNLDGGAGRRTVRPITAVAAAQAERLAAGELIIDLTALPAGTTAVTIDAEVGFGRLRVTVPAGATLQLDTKVGAGRMVLDGREISNGLRNYDRWIDSPTGPSGLAIVLGLRLGAGEITIDRATEP
jgi:phage shock protein PspC (stress-responsive transcriptional regulator)